MLETPTSGQVLFEGKDTQKFSENELTTLRERMGMVFKATCSLFDGAWELEGTDSG